MTNTSSYYSPHRPSGEGEFSELPVDNHPRNGASNSPLTQFARWPAKKMEDLYDFSRQMVATNSIDNLLDSITRRMANLVQASFCRILALEADGAFVCLAAYHSVPLAYRWLKGKTEPQVLSSIYEHV